jgi:hypothetical protein
MLFLRDKRMYVYAISLLLVAGCGQDEITVDDTTGLPDPALIRAMVEFSRSASMAIITAEKRIRLPAPSDVWVRDGTSSSLTPGQSYWIIPYRLDRIIVAPGKSVGEKATLYGRSGYLITTFPFGGTGKQYIVDMDTICNPSESSGMVSTPAYRREHWAIGVEWTPALEKLASEEIEYIERMEKLALEDAQALERERKHGKPE